MNVDEAMTVETSEQTAQDALVALQLEVERLHTWDGLMSILDAHYPPDVFTGDSADPGARLIALMREVERLRALMTPPVDPLQVVALGQARLLIAGLTEKVERLGGIEKRAVEVEATEDGPAQGRWAARYILGEG